MGKQISRSVFCFLRRNALFRLFLILSIMNFFTLNLTLEYKNMYNISIYHFEGLKVALKTTSFIDFYV